MNLHQLLQARRAVGKPVRVALIGAGKFGSMFLAQVPHTPGLEVPVIVDIDRDRAREACRTVGWDEARIAATVFTDDGMRAISGGAMDVIVEATGNPAVGIRHARAAIAAISMADLVPSRNELNICGFMPADCASPAVSP